MFMTTLVLARTPTLPTPLLSQCREWRSVANVYCLGQSDDVVPNLPGLHHQILYGSLQRKCVRV
ncbi:hypothetical protein ANCCAN_11004 [Ancylostoma caninum]|uniref:Uncharacterized protein n=1 Tax=Ancylostoma caninum TaxID=29170 RepID=A0A368GF72_ANCCA|nr:hypothetical protein ANCCAN_11004 [Ancylostoma caninum]